MNEEVLARLTPSAARRWFSLAVLGALGMVLIWLALSTRMAAGYQFALSAFGVAVLALGRFQFLATRDTLLLTRDGIWTQSGDLVARVDDVKAVDRGAFAFKPSNGFLLRTKTAQPRAWAPGLWWRMGRSIGVGGVTPAAEGKIMAELLQGLMMERDA